MALNITTEIVESIYETLRLTPPFKNWGLPHADDLEIHIVRHSDRHADHRFDKGRHRLRVSGKICRSVATVTLAVAHEMVHIREHQLGVKTKTHDNATFRKLADQVCRHHGFERGIF